MTELKSGLAYQLREAPAQTLSPSIHNILHNSPLHLSLLKNSTQGSTYRISFNSARWKQEAELFQNELQKLSEHHREISAYIETLIQQREQSKHPKNIRQPRPSALYAYCEQLYNEKIDIISFIVKVLAPETSLHQLELRVVNRLQTAKDSTQLPLWDSRLAHSYLMAEGLCNLSELMSLNWSQAELFDCMQQLSCQLHKLYQQAQLRAHRDLKPSNIVVSYEPGVHKARLRFHLIDFGVALESQRPSQKEEQKIFRCGTPPYMAPELQDQAEYADARADYYALGIILYELIEHIPCKTPRYFKDWLKRSGAPQLSQTTPSHKACNRLIQDLSAWEASKRPQTQKELETRLKQILPGVYADIHSLYWLVGTLMLVALSCGYIFSIYE